MKLNKHERRLILVVGVFLAVVWIVSSAGGAR